MTTTTTEGATPLTPPSQDDLEEFANTTYPDDQSDYVGMMLQQATDAIWVDTGITEYPDTSTADGARRTRVIRNAIMALALWAMTQDENRAEINSPFSSETIGSYHYSKMLQQAAQGSSGIWWLDLLYKMLGTDVSDPNGSGLAWAAAEKVFNPCGGTYQDLVALGIEPNPNRLDDVYGVWG